MVHLPHQSDLVPHHLLEEVVPRLGLVVGQLRQAEGFDSIGQIVALADQLSDL